jgi:DNA polymerase-3 subunit alpha
MPINAVHGIGFNASYKIINERKNKPFTDFFDFKKRMGSEINSKMIENLISAGFFDSFGKTHAYLMRNINSSFSSYISADETVDNVEEFSYDELRDAEYNALGFNLKYDLFAEYNRFKIQYRATDVADLVVDKKVNVVGQIKRVKLLKTKKGEDMAFVTLDCNYQTLDVVVFALAYKEYYKVLESKGLVLVNGFVRKRNDNLQVQLEKIKILK